MTINEQLLANFPRKINKSGEVFSALVANSKGTGAIESVLNDLITYTKEYYGTPKLYEQTGTLLKKTEAFISYLEPFIDESDYSLKGRLQAIFVREYDSVWGTPVDIKHVFNKYFPSARIYVVENTNDINNKDYFGGNLLKDGELQSGTEWTLSSDDLRSIEARFSKTYGLKLTTSEDTAWQTVILSHTDSQYGVGTGNTYESIAKIFYGNKNLADYIKNYQENPESLTPGEYITVPSFKVYFLHFFLNGKCAVSIKNSKNEYWNNTTEEWQETENKIEFAADDWDNMSLYFICKYDISDVTITFSGVGETCYVDYIRLFDKQQHSSFTLVAQFEGNSTDDALALADGTKDTEITGKMENYQYFDSAFLIGISGGYAQDLYEDLLEYVKAVGVKAYIEILNRDAE